jgi:hypothetical protein
MITSTSHKAEVMKRFEKAFQETSRAYDQKLHEVIRTPMLWPGNFGTTYRRSGEVVSGNFRNIYDLGDLDRSQMKTPLSPFQDRYSWGHHSAIVHEGATLRNGKRIAPRRFTRVAAYEMNIPQTFAREFSA